MRKKRYAAAALLTAAVSCGVLAGCKGDESSYKSLDSATAAEVAEIASQSELLTGELENKTIKWMANWDINPDGTGKNVPIELAIFQSRYGGKVEFTNVDWNSKFDALANAINGDTGIDFFPASDLDVIPRGAIKEMFVPIDDYIDFENPLFKDMKPIMDRFVWKDKHYVIANNVSGDYCVVIYNRDTMEENGLEDPAKLFADGKWDWNTFTKQLKQFCDPEEGRWGIDGWWFEEGLSATCGVPYIDLKDSKLINNLKDPAIARLQNWMYELGTSNCVAIGNGEYGWSAKPNYIGEGKTLFYPCGCWALYNDTWKNDFGEHAMFVPMPKDPNASEYYIPCGVDGYVMVKGGKNPEGVAKFAACKRLAITNERADQLGTQQLYDEYGWTDEMVQMVKKLHEMARANPQYDFFNAVSTDVSGILDSNETGIGCTSKGALKWSEVVSAVYSTIDAFLNQYNG
ncbi:MAG: ABC transporter substrate-binding protein [Oscillospiraceae bacterium]|nr:carbohydrate ABC transporter substrate-binding protein [Oscillospiraceae bacterium]MCR5305298.1 ABC transporter substrate-binding protein [Oscillospiraceae bacterium]